MVTVTCDRRCLSGLLNQPPQDLAKPTDQLRAFLLERGIVFRKGPANLRNQMPEILEDAEQNLSPRLRSLLDLLWQEWKHLDQQNPSPGSGD